MFGWLFKFFRGVIGIKKDPEPVVFYTTGRGVSAYSAFSEALDYYEYYYGFIPGYTGTIADKPSFVMIECPDGMDPEDYAEGLISSNDSRISDKHGPAGCIQTGPEEFLFFGYAPNYIENRHCIDYI